MSTKQDSITQYQLGSKGGSFTAVKVPYPAPGPNDVTIRTKAVGLNPIDWKKRLLGINIESFPAVLGDDLSGVVEAVGESVKDYKVGDEVFALAGAHDASATGATQAQQEVVRVPAHYVAKKPASLSWEEAAALPVVYLTAVSAIVNGLHLPLPWLKSEKDLSVQDSPLNTIFVPGGSSAVGASAIQLLRVTLPNATILTTSSENHHDHLISLGASKCFPRSAQDDPSAIKAATPDRKGVDAILDPVGACRAHQQIFETLDPNGPKTVSQVFTGPSANVPSGQGINSTDVFGPMMFGAEGGKTVFPALARLVEAGKFKVPVRIEVVGKGFEGNVEKGLEMLQAGVSLTKVVVTV